MKKRIRKDKIDYTLDNLEKSGRVDFYTACYERLISCGRTFSNAKEKSKLYAYLARQGFSSAEIQYAFNELTCDDT